MPSQPSSTRKQLVVGICVLVIGLSLLIGGAVAAGWRYHTFRGSESWPTTPSTIITSEKVRVDDDGDTDWGVRIQYEYTVDGVSRTAQTIGLGFISEQSGVTTDLERGTMPLFNEEAPAAALVARCPVGARVDAYHHPRYPEIVCLVRGDPTVPDILMAHFVPLFYGGMSLMVGVLLIVVRY